MLTIISFIVVFGVIVFLHEFGHFFAAKVNGVKVHEFALGMGPAILKKTYKDTLYSLRAIPIGGYVQMEGENEASDIEGSFSVKSPFRRFTILFAGAFMNFVSAFVMILLYFLLVGIPSLQIGTVTPNLPAYNSGLIAGDTIVSIESQVVESWKEVTSIISASEGKELSFKIKRESSEIELKLTPTLYDGRYVAGITSTPTKQFDKVLSVAIDTYKFFFTTIFDFLKNIGKADISKDLVGPVGLAVTIGKTAEEGMENLLFLASYISVNLGIINLLPLPALDGGRIIFVLVEMFTRKKVSATFEARVHMVGMALLLSLMAYLVIKDIGGLIL